MQGSAAVVNILCGFTAAFLFVRASDWMLKTFLYYVVAFSWFAGFGYLLSDPIFANENSNGDWAKVIMYLGGSWSVRLPILLVGAAGYGWAIHWLALHSRDIATSADEGVVRKIVVMLVVPYFVVNVLFTAISFWHPVPELRLKVALLGCWLGNFGLFAAAVGVFFQWRSLRTVSCDDAVSVPNIISWGAVVFAGAMYAVSAFFAYPKTLNLELW